MTKPGINFTTHNEVVVAGVHLDTFVSYFKQFANKAGWVNFAIVPNDLPKGKAGNYTHSFKLIGKAE